jgi:hypothetical protein
LTGIDSHQVVGQPISSILSLPEDYCPPETQRHQGEDGSNPQSSDISSAEANPLRNNKFALERLIATSGHGKIQLLRVVSKAHQMVGRSVTITKDIHDASKKNDQAHRIEEPVKHEDASSLRKDRSMLKSCRVAIAPIVSVSAFMPRASLSRPEDEQPKQKRRKSYPTESAEASTLTAASPLDEHKPRPSSPGKDHKKNSSKLVVTHYLIQLEDAGTKAGNNLSMESLSSNSTSVQARIVGLSKDRYVELKNAASEVQETMQDSQEPADDEGGNSESTVPEPFKTLG